MIEGSARRSGRGDRRSSSRRLVTFVAQLPREMPFYQFNSFTGRLKRSTGVQPLHPVSPLPLQSAESPTMIYDTIKTKPLTVTAKSGYCTDKPATLDPKIWSKYKHFQAALDKPVYLAGGKKDKFLFGFTVAYVAVCTLQSLVFIVKEGIMSSTK